MNIGGLYKISCNVLHFIGDDGKIRGFVHGTILTYIDNEIKYKVEHKVFLYDNKKYYIQLTMPKNWVEEVKS